MFKIEYIQDCNGEEIAILKLRQGDFGALKVNPKEKSSGEVIDFSLLSKIIFKFGSDNYKTIFTKELEKQDGYFLLKVLSEESKDFVPDSYIYEFECIFIDGEPDTPKTGKLIIKEELKG